MNTIKKTIAISLAFLIAIILCSGMAWAAPAEVNSIADLQSNVSGASGDTVIVLGDSLRTIDQTITLNVPSGANVTIQGGTGSGLFTMNQTAETKHFNVIGAGNITFENIEFVGNIKESDLNGDGSFKNGTFNSHKKGGGINLGSYTGEIVVENCSFTKIAGGAFAGKAGKITFEKTSFLSNANPWGAAITIENYQNPLYITNCTFANNYGGGWSGYFGGTISLKNGNTFVMNNSAFYNNIFLGQGGFSGGGGAIGLSMWDSNSIVQISDCVFENNTVTSTTGSGTADGGALYMIQVYGKINVSGSTFINNSAFDEGGAISFINCNNTDNKVINSTFYGNKAEGKDNNDGNEDGGGGAIEIYSSYANTYVTFEGNTFTKNTAEKGKNPDGNFGGAISAARDSYGHPLSTASVILINNIISGNTDSYQNSADYANIRKIGGLTADDINNNIIDADIASVFGTDNPLPIAIGDKMAGDPKATPFYTVIQTIPINPAGEAWENGQARGTNGATLDKDQNGNVRSSTTPDSGAIDMERVLYNATDGTWGNADIMTAVETNVIDFYDADNNKEYFQLHPVGGNLPLITKVPAASGKEFDGWWTLDGTNDDWGVKVESGPVSNEILYAKWKESGEKPGNGGGSGSGKVVESISEVKPSEPMPGYEETPASAPPAPVAFIVLFYMLAVACYTFVIRTDEE